MDRQQQRPTKGHVMTDRMQLVAEHRLSQLRGTTSAVPSGYRPGTVGPAVRLATGRLLVRLGERLAAPVSAPVTR
jgi:hypothetical protein